MKTQVRKIGVNEDHEMPNASKTKEKPREIREGIQRKGGLN